MSAFAADWLALREAADAAARDRTLTGQLATSLHGPLRVVDLGAGTGANLRYLAPRLAGPQHWYLLDHDPALLAHARQRCSDMHAADGRAVTVSEQCCDLTRTPPADWPAADLLTASALLDLVGRSWLTRLARQAARRRCAVLLTLSYSGAMDWQPADAVDAALVSAFNAHQQAQRPFAEPALGPRAAAAAAADLAAAGLQVRQAASDWHLGPGQSELLAALIDGWVAAASEQQPARAQRFHAWGERRRQQLAEQALTARVSHVDVLALPESAV